MENIQNYFIQITVTKGRIVVKDDGTLEKITDDTVRDDMDCASTEQELESKLDAYRGA